MRYLSIKIRRLFNVKCVMFYIFLLYTLPFTHYTVFAVELPRYEIEANIDTARHQISATEKVIFTNNSGKDTAAVYFHIYPHRKYTEEEIRFIYRYAAYFKINPYPEGFQSGDLKIETISSGASPLPYFIEGKDETILKVNLDPALKPGESKEINIVFKLDIPHAYGRFGWHKDIISLCRWYPILSVLDDDGWHNYPFYIYHQPYFSDAAYYKVRLRLPKDEIVASSGILKQEKINSDGTKTLDIETRHPLRDFAFGISKDFLVYSGEEAGVKINSYYLKGDEVKAKSACEDAASLMKFYTQNFVSYPYPQFNIVPSYLGYGGTQSSGLVFIDTRVYKLPGFLRRYFDFLIAHESGHQWFYNLVGSDEYREMFIDEGFNSYFILKYLQSKYGPDAKVMVLPGGLKWLVPNFSFQGAQLDRYSFIAKNGLDRKVLGELSSFQEPSSIFSITYGKGSRIIDMLNYVMGEEAFGKMMKRYFTEFNFKNISVHKLQGLASEEAGRDLSWFFDNWLASSSYCDYSVQKVVNNTIYLKNRGKIMMPVDVEVKLESGKIKNYRWDNKDKEHQIQVPDGNKIRSVTVDPDRRVLDLDRTNNQWRRSLVFKAVPLYFPAYEIPVFLKNDAYNIIAGPQLGGNDLGIKVSFQKPQDNIFYYNWSYNSGEERFKNILGFEQRHLSGSMLKWGLEAFNYNDNNGGSDQEGFKLYLRRELWPVSYGLLDENDHITFYLLRDRDSKSALTSGGLEDIKSLSYRQQEEAILGLNLKFGRYGAYPDPVKGWKFNVALENAEHFLGGQNYFWRFKPELVRYFEFNPRSKIAARAKLGLGYPQDKGLFQLGGESGLRGYGYKTINGSQAVMLNTEYRRDLADNLNLSSWENLIALDRIQGVAFFDVGKSWFRSFDDSDFKKDAGLGLRFYFSTLGFFEKLVLRVDVAQAINEADQDPYVWVGINHAF